MERELTKTKVLRYIAEHEPVNVKQMKEDLKISVGSIYHHLTMLGSILEQDQKKRYKINARGRKLLQDSQNNYQRAIDALDEWMEDELMVKPMRVSDKKLGRLRELKHSPIESKAYRNVYDLMATILANREPVFTITGMMKRAGMNHGRIREIVNFMKQKKLLADVSKDELPKNAYGRYLRVTGRGYIFLKKISRDACIARVMVCTP